MPDASLPPDAITRLGGTAFRLPGRYATIFLMPPEYRTYVAADAAARVYRQYDLEAGVPIRTILGPEHYGTVSRPSADGTRIAVDTPEGLRVVDLTDGRVVFSLPPDPARVRFEFAPTGDRLAVMIRNPDTKERESDGDMEDVYVCSVVVHDVRVGQREIRPLVNYGVTALFSADGRFLAVSGEWREEYDDQPPPFDGPSPVQVWDTVTGAEVARIDPLDQDRGVYAVAAAGGYLLLASAHTTLPGGLYDFATGDFIASYQICDHPGYQEGKYALSPDGRVLAGHAWHGQVVRRDARTGAVIDTTPCPFPTSDRSFTVDLGIRADGTVTALRVDNQTVRAWTAPGGRLLSRVVGGVTPINAIGFADGGREVRTAAWMETVVRRWDAGTGELLGEFALPEAVTVRMARVWFGPADRLIAWSREGLAVYHLTTGQLRLSQPNYDEASRHLSLSADGWLVALPTHIGDEAGTRVRVEHIIDGRSREIHQFNGNTAAAAYDRGRLLLVYDDRRGDRRTLVGLQVGSQRAEVLWSRTLPVGPDYRRSFRGYDYARVNYSVSEPAVLWASDGATALVVPRRERVPFLVDPATGDVLGTWPTAVGWPQAVHPSRPVLATATADGDGLILADWRTGERLMVVAEQCYPHALAWSPDGTRLVASLSDGTALVFRFAESRFAAHSAGGGGLGIGES